MSIRCKYLCLIVMAITVNVWAEQRGVSSRHERLSWGPTAFLQEGFRNAPWVKDPFFPEMNSFKLSGIISNEMAYINGNWYRTGDKIENYVVRDIAPTGVILVARSGETVTLRMEDK